MMEGKITLRALEPEDLDALYMIENDRSVWNVGRTNVPYSRYTLHDYIAHASSDIYTDRQVRLIIEDERGEVMGIADIVSFDPQHLRAELGIVIKSAYRRQGVAKAATEKMLRYAHDILHLHQVYVIIDEQNTAALELFNRLSFTQSARMTDWLYDGSQYHDAILLQRIL